MQTTNKRSFDDDERSNLTTTSYFRHDNNNSFRGRSGSFRYNKETIASITSSVKEDCTFTSCAVSMCLCANFVLILSSVVMCLLLLGRLESNISLTKYSHSRQFNFPSSNRFAESVTFYRIFNQSLSSSALMSADSSSSSTAVVTKQQQVDFEGLHIFSLSDEPIVDTLTTKRYKQVPLDYLMGGREFEYWVFDLNMDSTVEIVTKFDWVDHEVQDELFLDVIVGFDQFDDWQNDRIAHANTHIQLTSNTVEKFIFNIINYEFAEMKTNDSQAPVTNAYHNIKIDDVTASIYFAFYYPNRKHANVQYAWANFTVTYSNLLPKSPESIISDCAISEGNCKVYRDELPEFILIRASPDSFTKNESTIYLKNRIGVYTMTIPIALSPLMATVVINVLCVFSITCLHLSCDKRKEDVLPQQPQGPVTGVEADEHTSLLG